VFSFLEMVNRPDLDELQLLIAGPAPRTVTVKLESFDDMIKQRTGLVLQELTSTDALRIGLRDGQGLLIRSIERGSPAAQAELKAGMVVTGFDVTAVNDLRDFGFALVNKAPHDLTAKLTIIALKSLGGPYVQQVQAKVDVNLLKP
jgi:S1-C subfamily serine protease